MSKVTDYTELTTVAPDDLLMVVDVHDSTMSAQGTTKKIKVSNAIGSSLTNPMTTAGDTIYGGVSGTPSRLPGDTSNTRKFLRTLSSGGVAAPPAWDTVQAGDLPAATTSTPGAVILDGTATDIQPPGTQAAGSSTKAAAANHVHPAKFTATGYTAPAVVALTDAATIAVDASLGNDMRVTLGGNRTLGNPTNPVDGQRLLFQITQDATGSRTLSYGTAYEFASSLAAPTLSTAGTKTDLLLFIYNAAKAKWLMAAFVIGYA